MEHRCTTNQNTQNNSNPYYAYEVQRILDPEILISLLTYELRPCFSRRLDQIHRISWLLKSYYYCIDVMNIKENIIFQTCSDFLNIFDVDWFISSLAKDVPIVKRVPDKVMRSMLKPPYTMRVPRKSEPDYYLDEVLPILLRRRVRTPWSLLQFRCWLSWDIDHLTRYVLANSCNINFKELNMKKHYEKFLYLLSLQLAFIILCM